MIFKMQKTHSSVKWLCREKKSYFFQYISCLLLWQLALSVFVETEVAFFLFVILRDVKNMHFLEFPAEFHRQISRCRPIF